MPIVHMQPTDDIFQSDAEALVCPVNSIGVMGLGVAKETYIRYPKTCQWYKEACKHTSTKLLPGTFVYYFNEDFTEDKYYTSVPRIIFFAFTKEHWKDPSRLAWINSICEALRNNLVLRKTLAVYNSSPEYPAGIFLKSIALPAIGAGLGGIPWCDVKAIIEEKLGDLDCTVCLYPPHG